MVKCPHCGQEIKIQDEKKRSALKSLAGDVEEAIIDTIILGPILTFCGLPYAFGIAGGLAVVIETLCFLTHYFNDRLWNKTQFGRKVMKNATVR